MLDRLLHHAAVMQSSCESYAPPEIGILVRSGAQVARARAAVKAVGAKADDAARSQRRHQHRLDIGGEQVAVDRSVDHAGAIDAVVPQGGDEGQRLPVAVRHVRTQPLPAKAPPAQRRHVGLDPGLIDEGQPAGGDLALMGLPAGALEGDVRARLLGGRHGFF
jgi:hypothetical protein